jgi:phosphoglycolate phosphatase
MPIRLIIFDLDGTLVDSIQDITNALNFGFVPCGIPQLAAAEVAGMVGEGSVRLVEKVIERNNLSADKRMVIKRFADYYESHIVDYTKPYPGVADMLKEMKHYKKAVVSNKLEAFSKETLAYLGLSEYFDIIVGGDGPHGRKPSPMPIHHVLSTLGIKPEESIIVGDSEIDINTGKAVSVKTVAVTYGYGRPGFEKEADFVIRDLASLPALVRSIP